jgi:hypothetical protein
VNRKGRIRKKVYKPILAVQANRAASKISLRSKGFAPKWILDPLSFGLFIPLAPSESAEIGVGGSRGKNHHGKAGIIQKRI